MAAPTSPDELFAVVEKSRLVSAAVLGNYRSIAAAEPEPPDRVAERMVRDGVLTTFQAGLLLEGKSRPFFVGPYKVLSRIGNGNSGVVYLCEHVSMRRKVAVKVLQGRRAKDGVALQRFLREARAAAALNHPNVVHALDLGCEGDVHYLSMEYVDGSSLMGLVREEGPIPARRLAGYLRQAAAGLAHAHAAGLIHRDITPSNVMVGRDGVVKLLDLGLALFAECEENLTQGAPLGSIGYIAPEQALDGHAVDARADIYSLGATISFAMSGRAPSPRRGTTDTPAPKREGRTESDFERLLAIVDRMMAPDPAHRFQTAADVVEAVTQWVPLPVPDALSGSASAMPAITPAPAARIDAGGDAASTEFILGPEHDAPPVAAPDEEAPAASDSEFAFGPVRQLPKAVKRDAPTRPAPEYVPLTVARPDPRSQPKPGPQAGESWVARYWWLLVLGALAVGFGTSYVIRGQRETAADAIRKLPSHAVSPNSP